MNRLVRARSWRTGVAAMVGGALLIVGAGTQARGDSRAEAEPYVAPVNQSCGTWVLQQVLSAQELTTWAARIDAALAKPGVVGFSMRVPWDALEADPTLLDKGLALANARGKQFAVRFMAGRWTPDRVFEAGASSFVSAAGDRIPTPFGADGTPGNPVFEEEYDKTVGMLADWSRAHGVHVLHVPWYGFLWAEIYNGSELESQPGYSWEAWLEGHRRLAAIALSHAGTDLAVEYAMSGHWGAHPQGGNNVADALVALAGPNSPVVIVQGNGFGLFSNKTTDRPLAHAKQMYDGNDYDWHALYTTLANNDERYLEVYTASFTRPDQAILAAEIANFAAQCDATPPTVSLDPPGALLRGAVPLAASGSDEHALASVQILVDGSVVASGAGPGLSASWDTTTVPDGLHVVSARATDGRGNRATTDPVTVRVDNAPPPVLSVGSVEVVEGDSGPAQVQVTFTLSRPAYEVVSASYETADVTATAGSDYLQKGGQVVFPVGDTSVVETFQVTGDIVDEADESFEVTASSLVGASPGDVVGTVTIADDDVTVLPPPTMWITDASVIEGNSGTKKVLLSVNLSRVPQRAVTVGYATAAGTAKAGTDFVARSGTLRIAAGTKAGTIAVEIDGDRVREATERFMVNLSAAAGATLVDSVGVVTVSDND